MSPWSSTAVAVVVALIPAVLRWYWGRALGRLVDDPVLPERLLASQRRNQLAIFCATVGVLLLAPNSALWVMLLLLVAYLTAGYSLRRRLYNETWSVPAYLGFFGRLIVGAYGFWFLLLLTPTILSQLGRADWIIGAAIAGVLLWWNDRAADVVRWCLRAQPITDPVLVARFGQIVSAAKNVGSPSFDYIDMGGGAVANALALPSLTRPGVLFSSTLLGLLDADETIAISAHEVAHLEYYNRQRLTTGRMFNNLLIVMAVSVAPLSRLFMPWLEGWSWLAVLVVVMFTLILRAKDRQKNETASDLRGAELCGDPTRSGSATPPTPASPGAFATSAPPPDTRRRPWPARPSCRRRPVRPLCFSRMAISSGERWKASRTACRTHISRNCACKREGRERRASRLSRRPAAVGNCH
jgi:Zn-dependent protease with chaperone function